MTPNPIGSRRAVLYIDSLKLGGAERITLWWAAWLRDAGWTPIVLTRKPLDWDFYPIPQGVLRRVESEDSFWLRRLGPAGFPWRVWRLHQWLQREQISLAIGITSIPAIKLLLSTRNLAIPCVVSERNYPPLKRIGMVWRVLRRLVYPMASMHLVQTQAVADWQSSHLQVRSQILLPNPVQWPLPEFPPVVDPEVWMRSAGVQANSPILLGVGTKVYQKGFDRLVQWFIELADQYPNLQLVILGVNQDCYRGQNQQAELLSKVSHRPELLKRIHFPGRVGNVADWYVKATLFVLSSRFEGFPNVLLEAMAAGCCCIAADCPQGPSELITSDQNGVLVSVDASSESWVDALDDLLSDSRRRSRLAAGAQDVRCRFAPESLKRDFVDAIGSLFPQGGRLDG